MQSISQIMRLSSGPMGFPNKKRLLVLDFLIRKILLDPIGLHGQGAIDNYIPKFQVATMSLEVA